MDTEGKLVLNKKLAEWAGFTKIKKLGSAWCGLSPTAKASGYGNLEDEPLPNFTESLDTCFKWLVPKIITNLADIDLSTTLEAQHKLFQLWVLQDAESYATDLCLAIEKLVNAEA